MFFGGKKGREYLLLILFRDPRPIIGNGDMHVFSRASGLDRYISTPIHGFHRVFQKIHQHLLQLFLIPFHVTDILIGLQRQADVLLFTIVLGQVIDLLQKVIDDNLLDHKVPREVKLPEFSEEPLQSQDLLDNDI